jgi:hypothetical protein
MEDEIKNLYETYMKDKKFKVSEYRRMEATARRAYNSNAPLVKAFKGAWKDTDTGRKCMDSMKSRYIAVLAKIAPYCG